MAQSLKSIPVAFPSFRKAVIVISGLSGCEMVASVSGYEVFVIILVPFYIICNRAGIDFIHSDCSKGTFRCESKLSSNK